MARIRRFIDELKEFIEDQTLRLEGAGIRWQHTERRLQAACATASQRHRNAAAAAVASARLASRLLRKQLRQESTRLAEQRRTAEAQQREAATQEAAAAAAAAKRIAHQECRELRTTSKCARARAVTQRRGGTCRGYGRRYGTTLRLTSERRERRRRGSCWTYAPIATTGIRQSQRNLIKQGRRRVRSENSITRFTALRPSSRLRRDKLPTRRHPQQRSPIAFRRKLFRTASGERLGRRGGRLLHVVGDMQSSSEPAGDGTESSTWPGET